MPAYEVGALGRDEPIDLGRGVSLADLGEDRQRVDDVTDGGQLDQQNALEFAPTQSLYACSAILLNPMSHRTERIGTKRFIKAESRWRDNSRRRTRELVIQLNCRTRRSPTKGVWP